MSSYPKKNLVYFPRQEVKLVVIGGSAGALEPLHFILANIIPRGFLLPMIIVLHRPENQSCDLLSLLTKGINIPVKEAEDRESIKPGIIYLAPAGSHLLINKNGLLSLSNVKKVSHARPSIDLLFNSAANSYRSCALGIILSGAGKDGALGLKKIRKMDGIGIVENPSGAQFSYMPRISMETAGSDYVLNVEQISMFLKETNDFMSQPSFAIKTFR